MVIECFHAVVWEQREELLFVTQLQHHTILSPCVCACSHSLESETLLNHSVGKKSRGEEWRKATGRTQRKVDMKDERTGSRVRMGGGLKRSDKRWSWFSHSMHQKILLWYFFFPIAEVCCQEGSYRKDLGSIIPSLPEKIKWEKKNKGGTVNWTLCWHYIDMLLQTSFNQM